MLNLQRQFESVRTVKNQVSSGLKAPRFKQKACNMVRTHVKLIVEEDLSRMSFFVSFCPDHSAQDARTMSNRWLRPCPQPPIPNGRLKLTQRRVLVFIIILILFRLILGFFHRLRNQVSKMVCIYFESQLQP